MNLNNISLPYPVLGISDDILPELPEDAVQFELQADTKKYTFIIHLKFDNSDIQHLIDSGKAEFSCEFECARTMLRNCVVSPKPYFSIPISRHNINGRLNFNCYVSVKETIPSYTNKGFNSDYDGLCFNMEPGDILVSFPQFHYDADIKYDKLQVAGSFMLIRESNLRNEIFFDISGDKIEILLPTNYYVLFVNPIVKGSADIIHSSLVLNALTYALLNIESHEQTTWAKTIYYRLDTETDFSRQELSEPSNIPGLAQRLLKDPYIRLFNKILSSATEYSEE